MQIIQKVCSLLKVKDLPNLVTITITIILNNWRNKRLTLIGKISVVKALAASQLVYILSSTTTCPKSLKETNNLLFQFLWDNKGDKIKRTEMIADYQDGGQKMLDIIEFNKALKISWILK